MDSKIEPVLYIDPQTAPIAGRCERCGRDVYWPTLFCPGCHRDGYDTP